jgi:hypothetical protein
VTTFKLPILVVVALIFSIISVSGAVRGEDSGQVSKGPIPPTFFGLSMTAGVTLLEPWPGICCDIKFGTMRLWNSGVPWYLLNPAPNVYDWSTLDIWLQDAQQNGVDVLYTFGELPSWASSDPNDQFCAAYQEDPGSCDPPKDLNADGTGTDQIWKDFVTAIVTHAAGKIHYWETWNEASNAGRPGVKGVGQWKGTIAQMVRMARDARQIIHGVDPSAVVLSPSTRVDIPSDNVWLRKYLAAGGGKYAQAIAFHGYVQEKGSVPVPEMLIKLMEGKTGYKRVLKRYRQEKKQLFDTEASWGITASTGLTDPDEQAGFVSRYYLISRLEQVARFYWYQWDANAGTLWSPADVVVANGSTANNTVGALLGIGNGGLYPPAAYTIGTGPTAVTIGDFNGDGLADLAAVNAGGAGSNNVNVLFGNGDGTFKSAVAYPVGSGPSAVATGDFNNDGNLDLAVTDANNTVDILLNNGNGTFQTAVPYPANSDPVSVATGYFNDGPNLDLAVVNGTTESDGTVSILLGNGDGTFELPVSYAVGKGPLSVAAGDFDLDGNLDLAVTNKLDNTITILWGNGDGTFQEPGQILDTDNGPDSVVVGDFNHDGMLDLAAANRGGNDVSVLLNNGNRGFQAAVNYTAGGQPYSIATEDFIGNGFLDLVTANQKSNNVSVLLGNGDGTFQTPLTWPAGSGPVSVAVGGFEVYGASYPGTLLKSGCAYRTTYDWMVGNGLDEKACHGPIPPKMGVWSCKLTGPGGYKAEAAWDTSQSCKDGVCTTSNYSVGPQYTQYVTVYGEVLPVKDSVVGIGYRPILLENQNQPVTACPMDAP